MGYDGREVGAPGVGDVGALVGGPLVGAAVGSDVVAVGVLVLAPGDLDVESAIVSDVAEMSICPKVGSDGLGDFSLADGVLSADVASPTSIGLPDAPSAVP